MGIYADALQKLNGRRVGHGASAAEVAALHDEAAPNGYQQALEARRAAQGLGRSDEIVYTNGIPDPYKSALARLRRR